MASDRHMNWMSLVATIFCSAVAIMNFARGNIGMGLFQLILAIVNGYLYLRTRNQKPFILVI